MFDVHLEQQEVLIGTNLGHPLPFKLDMNLAYSFEAGINQVQVIPYLSWGKLKVVNCKLELFQLPNHQQTLFYSEVESIILLLQFEGALPLTK